MNKKLIGGIVGLVAVVGVAGLVASTTYARGGMMGGNNFGQGGRGNATSTAAIIAQRDAMSAHRDAVNKAIEAGDYTAWKAAMSTFSNGRGNVMTSTITEANFPKFVEMHKLMNQADAIGKEIGLDQGNDTFGPGMMGGRGYGRGPSAGSGRAMMGFRQVTNTATTSQ